MTKKEAQEYLNKLTDEQLDNISDDLYDEIVAAIESEDC